MTDKITNLNERRALKAEDNTIWTPADCVQAFQRDMASGEIKPTRVLIIYEEEGPDNTTGLAAYRANVQRDTEIALLWMMLHNATRRWTV